MKKVLFLMSAMLVLTLTGFSQNLKALDEKYGFREAKFEMSIDSIKNLTKIGEKGDNYKSTNENLKIGDYDLNEITYSFYNGQLCMIKIDIKGYRNSSGFLKILQSAYGEGDKNNRYIEEYWWLGEKVWMIYHQNSISNDATIVIYCNKLMKLKKADEDNANSKAANQL
jgi:hypothetical protein